MAEEDTPGLNIARFTVWVSAFALGALPVWGMWWFVGRPVEPDVYFHLAVASDYAFGPHEYRTQLTEGALGYYVADRELLFHSQLAALLSIGLRPLLAAGLLAGAASGAIGLGLYYHSRSLLVVCLGLLASPTALYRLLMCRPQGFAVAYVVFGIAFLLRGQYRWAALANLAYTWGYSVPVLLLAAAVLEAISSRRLRGLLWIAGASAAGLIIHPHFPSNLAVLWYQGFHVVSNALLGNPAGVELPGELKSWQVGDYCIELWLPLLLLGVSLVRRTTKGWLACLQVALCLLTLKMMRFIEYAVPLICIATRPTLNYALEKASPGLRACILCIGLLGVGAASLCHVVVAVKSDVRPSYHDVAIWLHDHGGDAAVFNSNWGAYPELRYFSSTSRIAQGHDAVFVACYDQERFKAMRAAIEGRMTLEDFRRELKYRFIVAERGTAILQAFADKRGVTKRFQDGRIVLLDLGG